MSEIRTCPGCMQPRYTEHAQAHVATKRRECITADPGEPFITFYKGNGLDGEFTWPIGTVRDAFLTATTRGDWPLKLDSWPLDRVLRSWLTDPDGFDSSWTDERAYGELLDIILLEMRKASREQQG